MSLEKTKNSNNNKKQPSLISVHLHLCHWLSRIPNERPTSRETTTFEAPLPEISLIILVFKLTPNQNAETPIRATGHKNGRHKQCEN